MAALLQEILQRSIDVPQRIARLLDDEMRAADVPQGKTLRALIAAGLDRIPLPAHGATLMRWQCLERVARHDLALTKLYESHTDALAILQEIDTRRTPKPGVAYAVWASESRMAPLIIRESRERIRDNDFVIIDGCKSWCSGAHVIDAALMTATDVRGGRWLVEVDMSSPGITVDESRWQAIGMRDSASFDVMCDGVAARVVGHANAYLQRPGFWHGGAGVAACWYGAAAAIGARVRDLQAGRDDVHALAHLGSIDCALTSGAALLRTSASAIDATPALDAARLALRVRASIADSAETVIHHASRAIGPGPLCSEPRLAHLVADLPIFIRQCRAEHDLVAQSRALLADDDEMGSIAWAL